MREEIKSNWRSVGAKFEPTARLTTRLFSYVALQWFSFGPHKYKVRRAKYEVRSVMNGENSLAGGDFRGHSKRLLGRECLLRARLLGSISLCECGLAAYRHPCLRAPTTKENTHEEDVGCP